MERYEKITCQGKRNDILEEIARLSGIDINKTNGTEFQRSESKTNGTGFRRSTSRDILGEDYGMTGRNIAKYLRLDKTIDSIKGMVDVGKVPIKSAVELSYLSKAEQEIVCSVIEEKKAKVSVTKAMELRRKSGELNDEIVDQILVGMPTEKPMSDAKIFGMIKKKNFKGKTSEEVADILENALMAWFEREMNVKALEDLDEFMNGY